MTPPTHTHTLWGKELGTWVRSRVQSAAGKPVVNAGGGWQVNDWPPSGPRWGDTVTLSLSGPLSLRDAATRLVARHFRGPYGLLSAPNPGRLSRKMSPEEFLSRESVPRESLGGWLANIAGLLWGQARAYSIPSFSFLAPIRISAPQQPEAWVEPPQAPHCPGKVFISH